MSGFPPPVKIITNIHTSILPTDLFDMFVTAWKLKSTSLGGLEIELKENFRDRNIELLFKVNHHGQKAQYIGKCTITREQLKEIKSEKYFTDIIKTVRSPNARVEKSKWMGFTSTSKRLNCHLIVFKTNDIKEIFDTMSEAKIPIVGNTSISSFIVNPETPLIVRGETIQLENDGQVFSRCLKPCSIVGVAKEAMKAGDLVAIDYTATDYEFRRAGPTTGIIPVEKEEEKIEEPKKEFIVKKVRKIVKINDVNSIREKLRR
jgi:hypothetical protein